jgi:hypothetical protein
MNIRATILGWFFTCFALAAPAFAQSGDAPHERVWLDAHNAERAEFGVAPLRWNPRLAREANGWAQRLAREEVLRHASIEERGGRGENLWMGTAGYYGAAQMISYFADEKRYFRPGAFPNVSSTGNWADVGHYTQIVWAETREVGCSMARGARFDVLVCRYWPGGNVMGTRLAPRQRLSRRAAR